VLGTFQVAGGKGGTKNAVVSMTYHLKL